MPDPGAFLGLIAFFSVGLGIASAQAFDEVASTGAAFGHDFRERGVCGDGVCDANTDKAPLYGIHGRLPELLRVHFAEALVSADQRAAFAGCDQPVDHVDRSLPVA